MLAAIFCLLFVVGCASTAKYEAKLKSWEGRDVNELISSWGPPTSTYDMPNGNKVYSYNRIGGTTATAQRTVSGGAVATVNTWACETSFTVDAMSVIRSWRYQGNACESD